MEFVEVDPIGVGIEEFEELSDEERAKLRAQIAVNRVGYRGLIDVLVVGEKGTAATSFLLAADDQVSSFFTSAFDSGGSPAS